MKMKNKKAEQIAAKEKHKEQLKIKRRSQFNLERPPATLLEKPLILIVCEGENTEPSYFNQFRLSSATVISVGEGFNTTSLVKRAKKLSNNGKYDQVWCVFDKDDFLDKNFNNAINSAHSQGFHVAYSNQAFEYWLILHFEDHQGGQMHRYDYSKKIEKILQPRGLTFENKIIDEGFFELLNEEEKKTKRRRVNLAIERAERNYNNLNHENPAQEESSTTVFKLVRELLKFV